MKTDSAYGDGHQKIITRATPLWRKIMTDLINEPFNRSWDVEIIGLG